MYEEDEDFPGDEDEYYFYVHQGGSVTKDNKVTEKTTIQIDDKNPDKDLGEALIGEGGMLASGALPAVEGMAEEGTKNLMDAMHKEGVTKTKQPKPKEQKESEQVEPKQPWESGSQLFCTGNPPIKGITFSQPTTACFRLVRGCARTA